MIKEEKRDNNIFDFIFEMAFRDATLRSAFKNPYKPAQNADKDFSDLKERIKSAVKQIVRDYIDSIMNDEPDKEVKGVNNVILDVFETANKLNEENESDQARRFTYGNAQKLVNMTAKYYFILCYDNPDLIKNFEQCHCPMDSVMIKIILRKLSEQSNDIKAEFTNIKLKNNTPWSKLPLDKAIDSTPPDEYNEFQSIVKRLAGLEDINPIQFDYKYWDPDSSL